MLLDYTEGFGKLLPNAEHGKGRSDQGNTEVRFHHKTLLYFEGFEVHGG